MPFTAHDVRHIRACDFCNGIGDGRKMIKVGGKLLHDRCVVQSLTEAQILKLPDAELSKMTLGATGPELMGKLLEAAR